jgi:hypothetical protein
MDKMGVKMAMKMDTARDGEGKVKGGRMEEFCKKKVQARVGSDMSEYFNSVTYNNQYFS